MTEQIITYHCKKCNRELGEFSASRSLEIHGKIICGSCAQNENPSYQEWLADMAEMQQNEAVFSDPI